MDSKIEEISASARHCEDFVSQWKRDLETAFESESLDSLNALLISDPQQPEFDLERVLNDESWVFISLCRLGADRIIERLLRIFRLDPNMKCDGLSALQITCRYGHVSVIELLLNHGAKLKDEILDEDSEFYHATINGQLDIVKLLHQAGPQFDSSLIYCLFHAACKGGHLEMACFWLRPDTDVNRYVPFVSTLDTCEFEYPLYAACQRGHYEVARFLIGELNARVTEEICISYPEMSCQLIRDVFRKSSNDKEQNFLMSELDIDHVEPLWFENMHSNNDETCRPDSYSDVYKTKVDLSKNRLSSLPPELIWELPSLTELNLSQNPLRELPCPKDLTSLLRNNRPASPACFPIQLSIASLHYLNGLPLAPISFNLLFYMVGENLTRLSLSRCHLDRLNIYIFQLSNLELLDASHNQIKSLHEEETDLPVSWKCRQLKTLNLSHNSLYSLPSLQECVSMECLDVSFNMLTRLCSPWQCAMKSLDISHNRITDFPPSCDQFWAESLHFLNASHNHMFKLEESLVKMGVLKKLDVSNNAISSMPKGEIWKCHLIHLNLSHNRLGGIEHSPSQKARSSTATYSDFVQTRNHTPDVPVELPASCLADSLSELYLGNNDLVYLPKGICDCKNLTLLDISYNPNLTSIPLEIGKLWSLFTLRTEGINVDNKDIQSMINDLNDHNNGVLDNQKSRLFLTSDFIMSMEQRRRECMHHDLVKMVVFGCKNVSGQCIVQRLINHAGRNHYNNDHKTLCVANLKTSHSKKYHMTLKRDSKREFKRDLTFKTWEFPVCDEMSVTHQCFLTENSIYLILHYAYYDEDRLEKVFQQIAAIQASVSQPCIIVVGIFLSSKDKNFDELNQILFQKISTFNKCYYVPFVFNDKSFLDFLLGTLYSLASEMANSMLGERLLVDRKVPKSFVDIVDKMKNMTNQISSRDDLLLDLELKPDDLQDTVDRQLRLQEYLLQVGAMLHYNDQMGDLWNLVILDPVWLYDVLGKFMKVVGEGKPTVEIKKVEKIAEKQIGLGLLQSLIALLEKFDIGMRIEDTIGMESFLIPSFLPEQPPTLLSNDISYPYFTSRLYCLPAIPRGLWSHIIRQLIPAFNRITNHDLSVPDFVKQKESSNDTRKSFKRSRKSLTKKGLCVKNKGIQFWASGIMVWHDQGHIVVEEVQYKPYRGETVKGILVTVKSRDGGNQSDNPECSHKELAAIGVITDELEEVLEYFNPKLVKYMQEYQPMALCPNCHKDIKPGQGVIEEKIDHFHLNICAQRLMWEDYVFCGKSLVCLSQIMPEFMFLELSDEFRIPFQNLEFMDEKLGQGMVGTVVKGRFKGTDVAIKSFYTPSQRPVFEQEQDPIYPNTGINDTPSTSMTKQDHHDTELKKILDAFLDLRREVSVLSKLKHKCIITFLGVCVKRQLLLVLELAPLGSFRSCLSEMKEKNNIPIYKLSVSDPAIVKKSVFGKDLTYKILLQVSSGLSYLHSQSIIFRDLKPDNILVMSLDLDAAINVKVSDYGISRFCTPGGLSGLAGTVCYMAPEVLAKQTYTNKVDIYSLGIVMFETVTGVSPIELHGTHQQPMVSEILKAGPVPMHVKFFKVSCNLPSLEGLMEECWRYRMDERPSIKEVIKRMTSDQFLLLHDVLWTEPFQQSLEVTCIYTCQTSGRPSIWISESDTEGSGSLRLLSVYDVISSMYTVRRRPAAGPKVRAMAKVREKIWMISEDSKQVEEIVRSTQNKFDVIKGTCLDEEPSCLVCHTWKPPKTHEDHAFALIGQTNGTITASHVHAQQHKTVITTTHLKLDTDFPITNIVTVSNDCLVVSAGYVLFQLSIQNQLSGDGLSHPSISVTSSYSLQQTLHVFEHVNKVVADKDCVWCSFDFKNRLVKFNWKEQSIKENLLLSIHTRSNTVDIVHDDFLKNEASSTYPKSDNAPPPVPLRISKVMDDLEVTSLCLATNLLMVGTDAGGLFLLPTSDNILNDACRIQIPLLSHLGIRKEEKQEDDDPFRLHSDSVVSTRAPIQNMGNSADAFSVSNILPAGNDYKLVSLLKAVSYESILRKQSTLPRRQMQQKRRVGFCVSDNELKCALNSDEHGDGLSGFTGSTLNRNNGNKHSITNHAEIIIWDFVSDARLNVIKGYRKGFC